jgi:hypothetical protein
MKGYGLTDMASGFDAAKEKIYLLYCINIKKKKSLLKSGNSSSLYGMSHRKSTASLHISQSKKTKSVQEKPITCFYEKERKNYIEQKKKKKH